MYDDYVDIGLLGLGKKYKSHLGLILKLKEITSNH